MRVRAWVSQSIDGVMRVARSQGVQAGCAGEERSGLTLHFNPQQPKRQVIMKEAAMGGSWLRLGGMRVTVQADLDCRCNMDA